MRNTLAPALIGLSLVISSSALASSTLGFAGAGNYSVTGTSITIPLISVSNFQTTGDLNLGTLQNGSLAATLTGATIDQGFSGTANFNTTYNSDALGVTLATTSGTYNGSTYSVSGNWTYATGAGTYAGLNGAGTFAGFFDPGLGQYSITAFTGTLSKPVPEPSAILVLGVGALALLARRRAA